MFGIKLYVFNLYYLVDVEDNNVDRSEGRVRVPGQVKLFGPPITERLRDAPPQLTRACGAKKRGGGVKRN